MQSHDLPRGWVWLPERPRGDRPYRAQEDMVSGAESLARVTLEGNSRYMVAARARAIAKLPKPRATGSAGSIEEAILIAVGEHFGITDSDPAQHRGQKSDWDGFPLETAAHLLLMVGNFSKREIADILGVSASSTAVYNSDRQDLGETLERYVNEIERLLGYRITVDG